MDQSVLRAIIFDFNGVLVDDEPLHLEMFQKVLQEEGIPIGEEEYYQRYLGLDDRGCFQAVHQDRGKNLDERRLSELIHRKAIYYRAALEKGIRVFPGVREVVPSLAARFPLAIASGALRNEIEFILQKIGLASCFQGIVSSEDVRHGKPHPETFVKALAILNQGRARGPILSSQCLAVEDSREGILAARGAGMKCLAVTNSYPAEELGMADAVVQSLADVAVSRLESLFIS